MFLFDCLINRPDLSEVIDSKKDILNCLKNRQRKVFKINTPDTDGNHS